MVFYGVLLTKEATWCDSCDVGCAKVSSSPHRRTCSGDGAGGINRVEYTTNKGFHNFSLFFRCDALGWKLKKDFLCILGNGRIAPLPLVLKAGEWTISVLSYGSLMRLCSQR